jgi:hypothetical protein
MATADIALIRGRGGVEFGVVCVRDEVIDNHRERDQQLRLWTGLLRRPVALLGARRHRSFGRRDIVGWLRNINVARLPWRKFTF